MKYYFQDQQKLIILRWKKEAKTFNSSFTGSLSLIGAITTLGDWFFSSLNSRNNSEFFISFMNDLMKWLTIDLKIDSRRIILIMDNSPMYTSNY